MHALVAVGTQMHIHAVTVFMPSSPQRQPHGLTAPQVRRSFIALERTADEPVCVDNWHRGRGVGRSN